mmetsp:Transcript_58831/g.115699  ORF Transcript_58831/g.115699 Transcript_58831/m.115699 type:complete len:473 (-) Transcript_58831:94-1512(-)
MRIERTANFTAAFISIFLYLSLACTCFYFASKFWNRDTNTLRGGRYAIPKFSFFVILGCSTLFDLPSFIGCVAHGGPSSCVWNDASYAFCWCCHLIASCGYCFAIITPSILWSDIVQQKDGLFINTSSPLDPMKRFFRLSFLLYCLIILMTIIGVCMYSHSSNEAQYSNSNAVGAIGNCLTPIMLFVITLGCVVSGLKLQAYIRNVQLGSVTQLKIIRKLSFTMMMIATTYGMRAMFVLSLYGKMPKAYIDAFEPVRDYPIWLFLTQWLPYVFCSFSLVSSMRYKEEGKVASRRLAPGAPGYVGGAGGVVQGDRSAGMGVGVAAGNMEDGRASPSKITKTASFGDGSAVVRSSFGIEGDLTKSPFDHTFSDDSSTHPSSTDGKTLDSLLAAATEASQKHSYFHHNEEDGESLENSPADGGSDMDHFFTTSALQARSILSAVSSSTTASSHHQQHQHQSSLGAGRAGTGTGWR